MGSALAGPRLVGIASAIIAALCLMTLAVHGTDEVGLRAVIVVGGTGYVFVALMAATSNDASVAWLGPRRWSLLHTIGAYWLWQIFLVSYLLRVPAAPANVVPLALVLGAWGLRLAARRRAAAAVPA